MKVVKGRPPIYDDIVRLIGRPSPNAIFTWGDTVFYSTGGSLEPDILEHEAVHARQQAVAGGPYEWWARYLAEPAFRLDQELQAYRVQYAWYCQRAGREGRRLALRRLASDLASGLYGNLIGKAAAAEAIKG